MWRILACSYVSGGAATWAGNGAATWAGQLLGEGPGVEKECHMQGGACQSSCHSSVEVMV